jgi:putative tricarboxylic transport membrane protein
MSRSASSSPDTAFGHRWPEIVVAGGLMLVAVLVIVDSLRVGIDWAPEGPRAGYFPFYIGLLLFTASACVLVSQLLRWRDADATFAHRSQIASVLAVLVPTGIYVALIVPAGLYVASFLLIAYFMRRHGKYRWRVVAAVAAGVPLSFYLVFERWFLVPLPKGPLEHLLGL